MQDRTSLRSQLRQQRSRLDPAACRAHSEKICEHLLHSWLYRRARRIAGYFATGNEASLELLLNMAWSENKEVYLPVLGPRHTGQLWFIPCTADTPIYKNRFGIAEPVHSPAMRRTRLRSLDLILMPLVGFDQRGHRLGMGGGYYDKTLASVSGGQGVWTHPKRIGIAYAMQAVESIPTERWDVPLDAVVTENGLHWFKRGKK